MFNQVQDYSFASEPVTDSLAQGFKTGYGMGDAVLKNREQEAQQISDAQKQEELDAAWAKAFGPDGTSKDLVQLVKLANPEKVQVIQKTFQEMSSEKRREVSGQYGAIYSALAQGQTKAAKDLLNGMADSLRASNKVKEANMFNTLAASVDTDPFYAESIALEMLTGSEEGLEIYGKINERLKDKESAIGGNPSSFVEKLQYLMSIGYTMEQGVKELTGAVKTVLNPVTGNVELIETATGKVTTLPTDQGFDDIGAGAIPELPEGQMSLWEIAKDSRVTGLLTDVAQKAQRGLGSVIPGASIMDPDLQVNRDRFTKVQNDLARSFRQGRYTASEQKYLIEELNIEGGAFTDIQSLRSKLKSTYEYLEALAKQNLDKLKNPRVPNGERKEAVAKYIDILQSMALVGNPREESPEDEVKGLLPHMTEEDQALFE